MIPSYRKEADHYFFSTTRKKLQAICMSTKGKSKISKEAAVRSSKSLGFKKQVQNPISDKLHTHVSVPTEDPSAHLERIASAFEARREEILSSLQSQGYYVGDGLLGEDMARKMRSEAARLQEMGLMSVSKSTRWNEEKQAIEVYDKDNVFS